MPKSNLVLTIPDAYDNNPIFFKDNVVGVVHDALIKHGLRSMASEYAGRISGYITKHPPQKWNFNVLCDAITGEYVDIHFLSHVKKPEVKVREGYSASHTTVINMLEDMDDLDSFHPVLPSTNSHIIISPHDSLAEVAQQTYDALNSDGYEHDARDFIQRVHEMVNDFDPMTGQKFPVTYEDFWTLVNEYVWITDHAPKRNYALAAA